MQSRSQQALAFLLIAASAVACADRPLTLTEPVSTTGARLSMNSSTAAPEERAALTELTRYVALALRDEALRKSLKADMRAAPFKEHKLELKKHLTPALLAKIASGSGASPAALAATLKAIRPLEVYLPVAAHRESWTGTADILVASQLDDGEPIVAYNLKGEQVAVSEETPPTQPTMTIVPVETRFDKPVDLTTWANINDRGGDAIGTMAKCGEQGISCTTSVGGFTLGIRTVLPPCEEDCGGGGSPPPTRPPGLYMHFSRIVNTGEPWSKGDPEIEVHLHGPTDQGNTQYGADLSCAGEHAGPYRVFNQDNSFWEGTPVQLFNKPEMDNFNALFDTGHSILFWEDDDTACVIKTEVNPLIELLHATAAAAGAAAVKFASGSNYLATLAFFALEFFQNASWLLSNDDYLGALVIPFGGQSWSDANLTLMRGGSEVNGRARLLWQY